MKPLTLHPLNCPARRGFTLIELMITMAIVGILAAIAYPSYLEQVAKGKRADAQSTLVASQQWMERFYSENYRYDQTTSGTAVATLFGQNFRQVPANRPSADYTISITDFAGNAPGKSEYLITATRAPTGSMKGDSCGDFTIDYLGRKNIIHTSGKAASDCWK